jgi:hypothetical protein
MMATHELVVPRSMPMILPMCVLLKLNPVVVELRLAARLFKPAGLRGITSARPPSPGPGAARGRRSGSPSAARPTTVLASCSAGTMLMAWCWCGSNLVPAGGAICTTLLRSSAGQLAQRGVTPSSSCSVVAFWIASAASRLSITGSRLSAKASTANLRALTFLPRRGGGCSRSRPWRAGRRRTSRVPWPAASASWASRRWPAGGRRRRHGPWGGLRPGRRGRFRRVMAGHEAGVGTVTREELGQRP